MSPKRKSAHPSGNQAATHAGKISSLAVDERGIGGREIAEKKRKRRERERKGPSNGCSRVCVCVCVVDVCARLTACSGSSLASTWLVAAISGRLGEKRLLRRASSKGSPTSSEDMAESEERERARERERKEGEEKGELEAAAVAQPVAAVGSSRERKGDERDRAKEKTSGDRFAFGDQMGERACAASERDGRQKASALLENHLKQSRSRSIRALLGAEGQRRAAQAGGGKEEEKRHPWQPRRSRRCCTLGHICVLFYNWVETTASKIILRQYSREI